MPDVGSVKSLQSQALAEGTGTQARSRAFASLQHEFSPTSQLSKATSLVVKNNSHLVSKQSRLSQVK